MALQKKIEDNKGIEKTYHRISKIDFNIEDKTIQATVKSYKNVDYRNKEKRYLELQKLIADKEKALALQEIKEDDDTYVGYLAEMEYTPYSTVLSTDVYTLENIDINANITVADVYTKLKERHGIFIDALDI
ncbi:hypothetical protein [Cetobacterium sp.]|uniref:hypothetical protein n=1 Tax=Cetobacterium sp. TaxID=2071632 RepID=UPI002FCB4D0D